MTNQRIPSAVHAAYTKKLVYADAGPIHAEPNCH